MTSARPTARELELDAAAEPTPLAAIAPRREPLAMLVRRGFAPSLAELDLPFAPDLGAAEAERMASALDRYGFRLFLRGAIHHKDGFLPEEATRFLSPENAAAHAAEAAALGLVTELAGGRYQLARSCASFGGTLEWYVAQRVATRLSLDAIAGVKFHAPGVGGDLDVVAVAEGKLIVMELKSSPPKHVGKDEAGAFFDRLRALRPHVSIFAVDTALRLGDKVVPLLCDAAASRGAVLAPRRIEREVWSLGGSLYAVNAKGDLVANLGRALAEGLLTLAPPWPGVRG